MKDQNDINDVEAKILESAEKEFLDKGYAGARTTSIAAAAGVTHAMLHYYFRTKDKLFEKVISRKLEDIKEILLFMIDDSNEPFEERLRTMVEGHYDLVAKNPKLPHFIINEMYSDPERLEMFTRGISAIASTAIGNLQQQLDSEAEKGNCRPIKALNLLFDIISLNIFSFLAYPLAEKIMPSVGMSTSDFLKQRKEENVMTILRKIRN